MGTLQLKIWVLVVVMVAGIGCSKLTPIPTQLPHVTISGGTTTGLLTLRRVELQFMNGRSQITVPRDSSLAARAIVQFNGNGLFRALWIVDGRVVGTVSMLVTFGDTLTIDTAPGTILPAFEPGLHEVTLRIEQPVSTLTVPAITYMVTVDKDSGGGSGTQ
jgi:hypothetical protein